MVGMAMGFGDALMLAGVQSNLRGSWAIRLTPFITPPLAEAWLGANRTPNMRPRYRTRNAGHDIQRYFINSCVYPSLVAPPPCTMGPNVACLLTTRATPRQLATCDSLRFCLLRLQRCPLQLFLTRE